MKSGNTVVILIISLFITLFAGDTFPQNSPQTVTVQKMPATVEEFIAMRDTIATTPEGGAAMFAVSMIAYVENNELGLKFFTMALDQERLSAGNAYKGFQPHGSYNYHFNNINAKKHIAYSYILGTSPDNGYLAKLPYQFRFSRNRFTEKPDGSMRIFIDCSGASSPRPLTMRKNNKGIWKVYEVSSLFVGIVPPKKVIEDNL